MADLKISQLNAITVLTPATDVLPVVDSGGVTKKITTNQILGSGGTATLASATITGNLTVDTNTLFVDSTNNRVGIGTASPAAQLHVAASGSDTAVIRLAAAGGRTFEIGSTAAGYGSANNLIIYDITGSAERFRIDSTGIFTFSNVGGVAGTAMTLNSAGLGVGTSPSYKVHVFSASPVFAIQDSSSAAGGVGGTINFLAYTSGTSGANIEAQIKGVKSSASSAGELQFFTSDSSGNSQQRFMVDGSGNVGIGVTPSAWASIYRGIQMRESYAAIFSDNGNGVCEITSNAYNDGAWKYANALKAARYQIDGANGQHEWYTAGTGTVGGTITDFATAKMTLDESGNLLVGTTGVHLAAHSAFQNNASGQVTFRNTSTTAGRYFNIGMNSGSSMLVVDNNGTGVYLDYATTSWASTSDERLKDIIEPISNAVAKVGSLRSVIGKFKTDSEGTRRSFLIAQDVQSVLPEAVDMTNADAFGVRYSEVIPLLVAAIKELTARVQTLEAK